MKPYINLVKYGLGGRQGSGVQIFSWIHVEDLFRAIRFVMDNEDMSGIYNCAAPNPIMNKIFMKEMRKIIKSAIYFPSPRLLLKIGAYFINTETELVLKSRWVIPKKLLDKGFMFKYPTIDEALRNILK